MFHPSIPLREQLCGRVAIDEMVGEWDSEQCSEGRAVGIALAEGDRMGESAALGSLGEVLRLQGRYDQAEAVLMDSLAIASGLDNLAYQTATNNGLGNV